MHRLQDASSRAIPVANQVEGSLTCCLVPLQAASPLHHPLALSLMAFPWQLWSAVALQQLFLTLISSQVVFVNTSSPIVAGSTVFACMMVHVHQVIR